MTANSEMASKNNIMRMRQGDYLILILIFILCGVLSSITQNYLFWAWDQGNILYPSSAMNLGLLPNISFRSGYLGLGFFIESKLVDLTQQDPLWISQLLFASYTYASAVLVYLVTRPLLPMHSAFGASLAYIFINAQWPANNPGSAASLLLLLAYYIFSRRKDEVLPLISLGVIVGIAIAIKQSAIYGALGITFLLCHGSKIKSIKLVAYLSALLGLLITVGRGGLDHQGLIVAIPLIACVILYRKTPDETERPINPKHLMLYVTAAVGTVYLTLLLIYGNDAARLVKVLNEAFVIVPGLIDRDRTIGYFPSGVLIWIGFGATLLAFSLWNLNHSIAKYSRRNALLFFGVALALAVYFGPNSYGFLHHLLLAAPKSTALLFHPAVVAGCFILLAYLFRYSNNCPALLKSSDLWSLLTFLSFLLLTQSHFVNLISFSFALVIPIFVLNAALDGLFKTKLQLLTAGVSAMIAIAVCVSFAQIYAVPITNSAVLKQSYRTQAMQLPYLRVAEWIETNTKKTDTIYGYPNLALAFYLARRFDAGFLPNFLGDESDILKMQNALKSSDRPEYFVVSKTNFPYVNHPYFYDYSYFSDVIRTRYHQVHSIAYGGSEVVTIFKAN